MQKGYNEAGTKINSDIGFNYCMKLFSMEKFNPILIQNPSMESDLIYFWKQSTKIDQISTIKAVERKKVWGEQVWTLPDAFVFMLLEVTLVMQEKTFDTKIYCNKKPNLWLLII
jgi:hypothetical protein